MAARVPLGKNFNATSGPALDGKSASVRVRIAEPPFTFYTNGTFTGTVLFEYSMDSPDVSDAAATWRTLATFTTADQQTWNDPLYRVRMNASGVGSGSVTGGYLENIRRTKREAA